jgi:hypothetical protein
MQIRIIYNDINYVHVKLVTHRLTIEFNVS